MRKGRAKKSHAKLASTMTFSEHRGMKGAKAKRRSSKTKR